MPKQSNTKTKTDQNNHCSWYEAEILERVAVPSLSTNHLPRQISKEEYKKILTHIRAALSDQKPLRESQFNTNFFSSIPGENTRITLVALDFSLDGICYEDLVSQSLFQQFTSSGNFLYLVKTDLDTGKSYLGHACKPIASFTDILPDEVNRLADLGGCTFYFKKTGHSVGEHLSHFVGQYNKALKNLSSL